MFCTCCGAEVHPGQRFCASCSRPTNVGAPAAVLGLPPVFTRARVAWHIRLLAIGLSVGIL